MSDLQKDYEGVLADLKYLIDRMEQPTYNQLEQGFRHSPLSHKEALERYKSACSEAHHILSLHLPKLRAMYEDWSNYDDMRNT